VADAAPTDPDPTSGRPADRRRELRVDVLGVEVSCINLELAVDAFARWIAERTPTYVCVTGMHGVMESQRDPALRSIHNASGLTTPDGMPMVWAGRFAGAAWMTRVYGPDLMDAVCARALEEGWRMHFLGGAPGVAARCAERLAARFPGLSVTGTTVPPFRELTAAEDEALVAEVNEARPDIVWVGLGTPKQEFWMHDHRDRLEAPVLVGVGAALAFFAGELPQAPRWMQQRGLEWLYRLAREPRRLWRRYLLNIPRFGLLLLRHPPRLVVDEQRAAGEA
jgi:N-acetylglucosaminyldiphosphoundecaprenol N-acetyl-beta-D-mannosaminyltransferase